MLIRLVLSLLFVTGTAWAFTGVTGSHTTVACTGTSQAVTFTDDSGTTFKATSVTIVNDDATNSAYYTLESSTATTSDHELQPGEVFAHNGSEVEGLGVTCDTSASVRVDGYRD